eukprot:TRINITY_DN1593_c0_g1_i1.p1 TRINITY_DN1593_c0_g1~~TRINITY_DN1593_c0_g1_i1.p1  ORF type:complete len:185 (-),score=37.79 TRINITY_DN1593_c0_g1_i1:47-547(-)
MKTTSVIFALFCILLIAPFSFAERSRRSHEGDSHKGPMDPNHEMQTFNATSNDPTTPDFTIIDDGNLRPPMEAENTFAFFHLLLLVLAVCLASCLCMCCCMKKKQQKKMKWMKGMQIAKGQDRQPYYVIPMYATPMEEYPSVYFPQDVNGVQYPYPGMVQPIEGQH